MTKQQEQVREFMLKAGQDVPPFPIVPHDEITHLRCSLIQEELDEYYDAAATEDLIEIADAIADLLYVVLGTAVAHGIDIEPIFDEVHKSNMSKFIDGHKDESGKWMKGPSFFPPKIKPLLETQRLFLEVVAKAPPNSSPHSQPCDGESLVVQPEPFQVPPSL